MLDFIFWGAQGHGPIHLLLISAAELGFAWDGDEKGWVRVSLPPLRMMTGPVQHLRSAILGFLEGEFAVFFKALYNYFHSTCGNEWGCLERIPSWPCQEGGRSLLGFAVREMVMVIFSGSAPFPPFSMLGNYLSFLLFCPLIAAIGLGVFFAMGGLPGLCGISSFGDLAFGNFERCLGAYPVDFAVCWTPPEYWDAANIALEMHEYPNVWTDGSREDLSSVGGFEVAGAGVYLRASDVAFDHSVWGTAEEYGDARLERCRALMPVPGVMQTVQRAEF